MRRRWGREGLGEVMLRVYGPLGRVLLALFGLWFVLLAGFSLRSGADRFIHTIYPHSDAAFFTLSMLLAVLPAVWGSLRSLARAAMLFRPLLLGVLGLVLLFALPQTKMQGLWVPAPGSAKGIALGALDAANLTSIAFYLAFFGGAVKQELQGRSAAIWCAVVLLAAEGMVVATVGTLGTEMAGTLHHPFFAVARDLTLFGTVEHVEAVLVTVWVLSDFVHISVLLHLAGHCALLALGPKAASRPRCRRWAPVLCALAAGAASVWLTPSSLALGSFTRGLLPGINLALSFGVLPLTALLARWRARN